MSEPNQNKPPQERYLFKPFVGSSHSWALSILERQPKDSKLLDFGCGSGAIGQKLLDIGFSHLYATDLSPEVREHVKGTYLKVAQDLESLDEENFDIVLLLDVIEHMTRPRDFLYELIKRVRPGGQILISVPNIAHWSIRLQLLFGFFEYTDRGLLDKTHYTFFTRRTMNKLIGSLDKLEITATDVSISPAELLLPQRLRDNALMNAFNVSRLTAARALPGIGAYQLLTLIRKKT